MCIVTNHFFHFPQNCDENGHHHIVVKYSALCEADPTHDWLDKTTPPFTPSGDQQYFPSGLVFSNKYFLQDTGAHLLEGRRNRKDSWTWRQISYSFCIFSWCYHHNQKGFFVWLWINQIQIYVPHYPTYYRGINDASLEHLHLISSPHHQLPTLLRFKIKIH